MAQLGSHNWRVTRLIAETKDLPILNIPLRYLSLFYTYDNLSIREFVMHVRAMERADLSCPIILDEDGALMDGHHRIMKALHLNHATIKAVRFEVNPTPCYYSKD